MAGRGSYSIVYENENLKAKVIQSLNKATSISLKNCKISHSQNPLIESIDNGKFGEIFRNEYVSYYAIFDKNEFNND